MKAINPFADPEFKKQILGETKEYEVIEDDNPSIETVTDMKSIISQAPKLPVGKDVKNIIVDASALAKNEKDAKAKEMQVALNNIFTEYNKTYNTDLQIDFSSLSQTLVNVANPKKRRVLELYLSEVFQSMRPILILHMIQKLSLALDYVTDPQRMFDQNSLSIPDLFLVCEKLMQYIEQLNSMKDEVVISGADLELKKIAEENKEVDFNSSENKEAIDSFMKLLYKESGINNNNNN